MKELSLWNSHRCFPHRLLVPAAGRGKKQFLLSQSTGNDPIFDYQFFFFLNSQKLIHRPKHMISLLISDLLLFSFLSLFLKDMSLRDTLEHPRD